MTLRSWQGRRSSAIAADLGCHPQTVRDRIASFDGEGIDGLGDRPGAGRKLRLAEAERSTIIAPVATPPPGRLVRDAGVELAARDEDGEAHWTLDALTGAAQERGVRIGRSQVRRILLGLEALAWEALVRLDRACPAHAHRVGADEEQEP